MSIGSRFVLFVGVIVAGVIICPPIHLAEEIDGLFGFPQNRDGADVEEADQDLRCKTVALMRRIEAKESVLFELLQGEISFREAVRSFRDINNEPPILHFSYSPFSGATPEERAAQQVILWARAQLQRSSPDGYLPKIERLEREMEEWLCGSADQSLPSHLR